MHLLPRLIAVVMFCLFVGLASSGVSLAASHSLAEGPVAQAEGSIAVSGIFARLGPRGVDIRSMPPLAAIHPLVVAAIQAMLSLMALVAFPIDRTAAARA